jgi:hypothetical protein
MKIERTRVYNIKDALRGMRNPMDSWHLADTRSKFTTSRSRMPEDYTVIYEDPDSGICEGILIGPNDKKLTENLIRAGSEHRKFLR